RNVAFEQDVRQRTTDLEEARDRAETSSRVKSEFLANMSHELRTPLNAIIGYSHCIRDGIDGPVTNDQIKSLNRIVASSDHLLNMINGILDLAKIESGKFELVMEKIDLAEQFHSALDTVEALILEKNIKLERRFSDQPVLHEVDAKCIQQVMLNLLANAIKFTEKGAISVEMEQTPETTSFSIEDTGIGLDPDEIAIIFDEFTQADSGTTRQYEGTGLGLTISRKLVRLHGGEISVESEKNNGSRFTVNLPIQRVRA
ncbi:MAG: ATP-binding protein, partial [Verrucomicrobiota bacterium]